MSFNKGDLSFALDRILTIPILVLKELGFWDRRSFGNRAKRSMVVQEAMRFMD